MMADVKRNGYYGYYGYDPIYSDIPESEIRETDILGDSDPEPDTDPLEVLEDIGGTDTEPEFREMGPESGESGSDVRESRSALQESGSGYYESRSEINESRSEVNESRSEINESGSEFRESGSGFYESGPEFRESVSSYHESRSDMNQNESGFHGSGSELQDSGSKSSESGSECRDRSEYREEYIRPPVEHKLIGREVIQKQQQLQQQQLQQHHHQQQQHHHQQQQQHHHQQQQQQQQQQKHQHQHRGDSGEQNNSKSVNFAVEQGHQQQQEDHADANYLQHNHQDHQEHNSVEHNSLDHQHKAADWVHNASGEASEEGLLNLWDDGTNMSLGSAFCSRCGQGFSKEEEIVNSNGEMWHPDCFVCAQCFRVFPDGIFYEFEGRKYCEDDFKMLFAPFCAKTDCNNFIVGRVIKAMNANWHPECFMCELCSVGLADSGYFKNANRALCKECNDRENAAGKGKYICHKCKSVIEEGHIKWKGEPYHPYHFNCKNCKIELASDARELSGELYCLRCHDKMGIPICGACRRPIDGERIVHALGKSWHVEHFVCAQCEKPFLGTRHYEKKGLAYCELHYHQLFGNICFTCNSVIAGDVFSALNKAWCVDHFACYICAKKMSQKTKFYEFDLKPVCKHCYEKFPSELKKRQKKAYENSPKK